MNIKLYQNLDEPNVVDKRLNNELPVTGYLRDESSIIDPSFEIDVDDSRIINFNYCYIEDFNRYYFVNNVTSIVNGLWLFNCHVDVLSSFKDILKLQECVIARQENLYNLYLDDDKLLVDSYRINQTKEFPNKVSTGNRSFIVALAGGKAPPAE